jgi:Protein of unknown function (DUF992)
VNGVAPRRIGWIGRSRTLAPAFLHDILRMVTTSIPDSAMIRSSYLLGAFVSILVASPQISSVQSNTIAGVLECRAGPATTFLIGSIRDFDCLFWSIGAPSQRYVGTIQRLGMDLGWSSGAALVWHVFAPTSAVGPGALAGGYAGVSAGAAIGLGVAANAMVGGLNNSFTLQPVSIESQTGLNVFAGISSLELTFLPPPLRERRPRKRP